MNRAPQTSVLFHVKTDQVDRRSLREFARMAQGQVADGRSFCCLIADDAELRRLNREFRNQDHATDVLSFPSDHTLGDIAISLDRAREQASALGHTAQQELQILLLHGLLHLTGLDHENDRGEMARAERRWRKHFGLPAGLIERVS